MTKLWQSSNMRSFIELRGRDFEFTHSVHLRDARLMHGPAYSLAVTHSYESSFPPSQAPDQTPCRQCLPPLVGWYFRAHGRASGSLRVSRCRYLHWRRDYPRKRRRFLRLASDDSRRRRLPNTLNGFRSGFAYAGGNHFYGLVGSRARPRFRYAGGANVDFTTSYPNRLQQFTLNLTPNGQSPDASGHFASYAVNAMSMGTTLLKNTDGGPISPASARLSPQSAARRRRNHRGARRNFLDFR